MFMEFFEREFNVQFVDVTDQVIKDDNAICVATKEQLDAMPDEFDE